MHTGRRNNFPPLLEGPTQKNVTWEQRQRQRLLPVRPLPNHIIRRQKYLYTTPAQIISDTFFVLIASIKCVPFTHLQRFSCLICHLRSFPLKSERVAFRS